MLSALQSDQVFHYATDVFTDEPPVLNNMLLSDKVTLTPHIGGFTVESIQRATEGAVENILKELAKIVLECNS